jgi:hypothetical protein
LFAGVLDFSMRGPRLLITILLAIWLGAILIVAVGVPRSFAAIDNVMTNPPDPVLTIFKKIGPVASRALLRYQIAEANRMLFGAWGWIQLILAATVFGLVLFATRARKLSIGFAGLMLFLAATMNFFLVPRLDGLSRVSDFAPSASTQAETSNFSLLHRGFTAFEATVAILGAALFMTLAHRGSDSGATAADTARREAGMVDLAGE